MEGRVAAEHRFLDELFEEVRAALGSREAACASMARLVEYLDVHFEQEDRLYFPTIASLRPELAARLRAMTVGHERFREHADEVRALLERGDLEEARRCFDSLARDFVEHERAEEDLLLVLQRELALER